MNLDIVKYCAEECVRQGKKDPMSTYDMCNAWEHAKTTWEYCLACVAQEPTPHDKRNPITLEFIERLGQLVEPDKNKDGFRTIPIGVSDGFNWIEKAPWERVPFLLQTLIESYYEGILAPTTHMESARNRSDWKEYNFIKKAKTAEDVFYFEYENIHPFADGNGRTGKILYNYLKGTLDNPVMPPNFWGGSNP